ncbi:MAG: FecR domain-containing protein [Hyphomicrobiaceae bacterium]|nr:FecR domain-containing protein [Hyphomicrobiaceae bacterium]
MSAEERAAFDAWLAADTDHRTAFEKVEKLWRALGGLEGDFTEAEASAGSPVTGVTPFPELPSNGQKTPITKLHRHRGVTRAAAALAAMLAIAVFIFAEDIWIAAFADVATGAGHKQEIVLPDNSRVTLNTASALAIDYTAGERRIRLLRGEAFFDVRPDTTRPFRVEASEGLSEPVGTAFAVRKTDDSVVVTVTHGEVAVRPAQAAAEPASYERPLIVADRQIAYRRGIVTARPREVDVAKMLAWRTGKIVFEDMDFSEALAELDRYLPGRIVVASRVGNAPKVSGVFETNDVQIAVRAVAAVHGLSVAQTPGNHLWVLY